MDVIPKKLTSMSLDHRRKVMGLGQRAIDYYLDTGLCVFCEADDCSKIPHEEHCNVGEVAGITVLTKERIEEKAGQRAMVRRFLWEHT